MTERIREAFGQDRVRDKLAALLQKHEILPDGDLPAEVENNLRLFEQLRDYVTHQGRFPSLFPEDEDDEYKSGEVSAAIVQGPQILLAQTILAKYLGLFRFPYVDKNIEMLRKFFTAGNVFGRILREESHREWMERMRKTWLTKGKLIYFE